MSKSRSTIGQCDLMRALCELSSMFSDTAYKVVMALVSRLDYKLENTLSVMSLSELRARTAKTDQQILSSIRELEARGLLTKTSGKYHKEDARMLRSILYHRAQGKTRSYNEINAYDLRGLVELVRFYSYLTSRYDRKEVLAIMNNIREEAYAIERKTKEKASYLELIRKYDTSQQSDTNIIESDTNIIESDTNIIESDTNICEKPPSSPPAVYHTHTPTGGNHERDISNERKGDISNERGDINNEGKDISDERKHMGTSAGGNFQTETIQPVIEKEKKKNNTTATATATATATMPAKAKTTRPIDQVDDKLKEYILSDLVKQEQEGKIRSANAIMKTLTEQDIELYRQKMEEHKKEEERQKEATQMAQWKVLSFHKDHLKHADKMKAIFGENWEQAFKTKRQRKEMKESNYYVFLKVRAQRVNDILSKAQEQMIYIDEYDYTKDYEKFFAT